MKEFKDIGFFDENIFIYLEEMDLCKRLKKNNKKIFLAQNVIIHHVGGSSHNAKLILKWNYQEIGTGCGLHFILTKNIMVILFQ